MHPLLGNLGPIPIHTYGFMIAIGFLISVYTIRAQAIRARLDVDRVLDLTFWILLVGFLGARVLFILTKAGYFLENPLEMIKVWEGGLVFLGGPIAAMPFTVWYLRKHKLPVWLTLDAMIPGLVVAHGFGRMGCLAAGCCYGKPTGGGWGVKLYSELVDPQFHGIPLHPVQLYEASALFLLFAGMMWVFRHRHFNGQVILTYFIAYPVIRSIVEIFRGDLIRGFVIDGVLSTSQFISILIFAAAIAALFWRLKQVGTASGPLPGTNAELRSRKKR